MRARDFLHSGRRGFLRGLGGTVLSLPLLELTHGRVRADAGVASRFVVFFEHGGTLSNQSSGGKHDGSGGHHGVDLWAPADPGERLVLGPIHQPLAPHVEKLLVLQGLDNRAAIGQDRYRQGGHGIANYTALTASRLDFVTGDRGPEPVPTGPSIDQVIAARLAARAPTPFERVHLEVGGSAGGIGYGTPFVRGPRQSATGYWDPILAFTTLFAGVGGSSPGPAAVRRTVMRRSVLDGVVSQLGALRGVASTRDMHTIEAHLEHLRALEREVAALSGEVCEPPSSVLDAGSCMHGWSCRGIPMDVVGPLQVRIGIAALRCGLTNVLCLEVGDMTSPWTEVGTLVDSDGGHGFGHIAREIGRTGPRAHEHDAWMREGLANRQWRMELLAELVRSLDDAAFAEPGGTMLDSSLVLATSEFSDASSHIAWNQPVLLAGSAGGRFRTGRNLDYDLSRDPFGYEPGAATHNLFTSILQAFGGTDTHFGSDDPALMGPFAGPLPGLA
jgi:hypothetical protein